jgi:hypothetical protein
MKYEFLKNVANTSNIQIKIIFLFFEAQDLGSSNSAKTRPSLPLVPLCRNSYGKAAKDGAKSDVKKCAEREMRQGHFPGVGNKQLSCNAAVVSKRYTPCLWTGGKELFQVNTDNPLPGSSRWFLHIAETEIPIKPAWAVGGIEFKAALQVQQ